MDAHNSRGMISADANGKTDSRYNGREDFPRGLPERPVDDQYRPDHSRRPRQRNRSRSPVTIDRYQPDARLPRDDYYSGRNRDDRRRPHSPTGPANIDRYIPGQDSSTSPAINPIADPLKLDYQVGFSYFAEWWRQEKAVKEEKERQKSGVCKPLSRIKGDAEAREEREQERSQIQQSYDSYKEELQVKMARSFVQQHKGEEWFKERYIPELRDGIRQQINSFRVSHYVQWEHDFDTGLFDDFNLEGMYRNESNGNGTTVEKEEGETVATADVLSVGDLVPSKGADIRDESGSQPTLLIKTIAPSVGRAKLEEFCKEHLGEGDGGYRWLSMSDPNPSKRYHRIGWVMLKPGDVTPVAVERNDERDEVTMGEDGVPKTEDRTVVQSVAEKALDAINGKTITDEIRGDFTVHVGIHNPPIFMKKKALWDLFSAPERIEKDLDLATKTAIHFETITGTGYDGVLKIEEKVDEMAANGLMRPVSTPSTKAKKAKKSKKDEDLDVDGGEVGEGEDEDEEMEDDDEEGAIEDDDRDDEELIIKKKKLDLIIEYLRRVYNFCLFCVFESDSIHELSRKCPGGHLRRPRASLSSFSKQVARASAAGEVYPLKREAGDDADDVSSPTQKFQKSSVRQNQQLLRAFNWVKTYEEKIAQILEPENVDLKKIGGKPVEEALEEELNKWVKQEDESKFRCKVPECTKLFKAVGFWRKHAEKRHPEWFEGHKQDLELVNTYVMDPSHIAPSRSDANSNGHFPQSNGGFAAGTPRGFNIQNMPMSFGAMMPGMPGATGFPPFFGSHAVTGATTWPIGGFNSDDRHQPGPMRRNAGGSRYTNRSGPYDRPQRDTRDSRDNRESRYGGGGRNGRLSPPRGLPPRQGSVSTATRWGDGQGAAAVGPREAVQGRSLKSYEDLDAVGGGGNGELNY